MKKIIVAMVVVVALVFAVQEVSAQAYQGFWDVKCKAKIANTYSGEIIPFSSFSQVYVDDSSQPASNYISFEFYNDETSGSAEGDKNTAYFEYEYDGLYYAYAEGYVKVGPKSMKAKIYIYTDNGVGFGTCTVKKSRY